MAWKYSFNSVNKEMYCFSFRVHLVSYGKSKWCHNHTIRVKSGIIGQTAKFGQPSCLFHSSVIEIKNKLAKQTVKTLMRRLIRSRLIWITNVCKCVSEFT